VSKARQNLIVLPSAGVSPSSRGDKRYVSLFNPDGSPFSGGGNGSSEEPPQIYGWTRSDKPALIAASPNTEFTWPVPDSFDYSPGAEDYFSFDEGAPTEIEIVEAGLYNLLSLAWCEEDATNPCRIGFTGFYDWSDTPEITCPKDASHVTISATAYLPAGRKLRFNFDNPGDLRYFSFRFLKMP
jgi:hypothetical protein